MDQRDEPLPRRSGNDDSTPYAATYNTGQPPQAPYQPPPAYQPHYAPPPAKRKRTVPLWATIITGVVAFAIGAAAGSGSKSADKTAATTTPSATTGQTAGATTPPAAPVDRGPTGDVALAKFTVDTIGGVTVPVTVTNHSSKTSNYIIEFEIDDAAGTKIGDGIASTNNLAPGQKAQIDGIGMPSTGTPATVKLTKVTRYAA